MIKPPIPDNEHERLAALRDTGLLYTPPQEVFDSVVRVAAAMFDMPMATLSLIDTETQFFKARVGVSAMTTTRDCAFCAYTILGSEPFVVPDACADERFVGNPQVTDAPNIRFYAGAPLLTPEGYALGALTVMDTREREFSADDAQRLRDLARQPAEIMELHRRLRHLERAYGAALREIDGLNQQLAESIAPATRSRVAA